MKEIVAIIPPENISNEVQQKMEELNATYHTEKALRYPPHITLKGLDVIDDTIIIGELASIAEATSPFNLTMKNIRNFGSTPKFPGIYIPIKRSRSLFDLHNYIVDSLEKHSSGDRAYKERKNFNPHCTLVGDDISEENLQRARRELRPKDYCYRFRVDEITLLREKELPDYSIQFRLGKKPFQMMS